MKIRVKYGSLLILPGGPLNCTLLLREFAKPFFLSANGFKHLPLHPDVESAANLLCTLSDYFFDGKDFTQKRSIPIGKSQTWKVPKFGELVIGLTPRISMRESNVDRQTEARNPAAWASVYSSLNTNERIDLRSDYNPFGVPLHYSDLRFWHYALSLKRKKSYQSLYKDAYSQSNIHISVTPAIEIYPYGIINLYTQITLKPESINDFPGFIHFCSLLHPSYVHDGLLLPFTKLEKKSSSEIIQQLRLSVEHCLFQKPSSKLVTTDDSFWCSIHIEGESSLKEEQEYIADTKLLQALALGDQTSLLNSSDIKSLSFQQKFFKDLKFVGTNTFVCITETGRAAKITRNIRLYKMDAYLKSFDRDYFEIVMFSFIKKLLWQYLTVRLDEDISKLSRFRRDGMSKLKEEELLKLSACRTEILDLVNALDYYPKLLRKKHRVFYGKVVDAIHLSELHNSLKQMVSTLDSEVSRWGHPLSMLKPPLDLLKKIFGL